MIRKKLQSSPTNNSNSGKNQQLQPLNLEQLDVVSGGPFLLVPAIQK